MNREDRVAEVNRLHKQAMEAADTALTHRLKRDIGLANEFFTKALNLERKAAELLTHEKDAEPSRSILFRSAAALAFQCRNYRIVEKMAAAGLSGEPPEDIAEELQDFLDNPAFHRHLDTPSINLGPLNSMATEIIENLNRSSLLKAFKRLKKDTKGFSALLVRDPVDYIDFESNLNESLDSLISEITKNRYNPQRPFLHASPKNKGINRPTVVFDVIDAIVYRFCIEQIEDVLFEKARQKNIRGGIKITPNRLPGGEEFYEKWFKDWTDHLNGILESLKDKKFLVNTDIASYFENINILVLKDLVRSDVKEKKGVMNLLFYFLENIRFRFDYEVNTFTGLPQEDIDCSRILAYYFLHPHDNAMRKFCGENDGEFYRFVDDMSIAVNSEVIGRKALKCITESLRRLNLVSSIEKTSIVDRKTAKQQLFFSENARISKIEEELLRRIATEQDTAGDVKKIKTYYHSLIRLGKDKFKNWIKILKRFYTLAAYTKSTMLFPEFQNHLIDYPILFTGTNTKICKYLIRVQKENGFNVVIKRLIAYLYSQENLYPAVETSLLELLLVIDPSSFSAGVTKTLKSLCEDVLFKKNGYRPLSDYARGLSCLLYYRYNRADVDQVADHYIRSNEDSRLLRKYLIFVSLVASDTKSRHKCLSKARREQDQSINRLVTLIDNIDEYKKLPAFKRYLKEKSVYYIYNRNQKVEIVEKYTSVRSQILNEIVTNYSIPSEAKEEAVK